MRSSLASVLSVSLFCAVPLAGQDVYLPSDQVTAPKVIKSPAPAYTADAMARRIQGVVVLQVDVLPDGTVSTVALVKSLEPGLDEQAAKTVKQWVFTPEGRQACHCADRGHAKLQDALARIPLRGALKRTLG